MRKKIIVAMLAVLTSITARAQFEADKFYFGASLSGLDLNYSGVKDLSLDVDLKAGYLVEDNVMLLGHASYNHSGQKGASDYISAGVGGRYYIVQNGIFLGGGVKYVHSSNYNDVLPGVEVGYAFFLSRTVTVEPSIYYDQSFKNHSDFSTIGFRIGVGVYL